MPAGFRNGAAADFDNVFDLYVQGTKPANTGMRTSDGVDLANRYAPLMYGTQAGATGFRIASGADVNTLWAAKGTAMYAGPKDPGFYPSYTVSRGAAHDIGAGCEIHIRADGTWQVAGNPGSVQGSPTSGTWHTNPAAGVGAGAQMRWTDAGPWISLATDQMESVTAFASTGTGGPVYDEETKNFQISIRNNSGTMEVRDTTSIQAEASV